MVSDTVFYKRATFVAHLPAGHRYTPSHAWIASVPGEDSCWRVGLTRFALRMLGELVELRFEAVPGQPVKVGEILGSIEGFKALSDLYCVIDGVFEGGNAALDAGLETLSHDVHRTWLYQVRGLPDPRATDVAGYTAVLDATIDRMLEKQNADSPSEGSSTHQDA
jgi:glycine cleavage system H protein